MSFPFHCNRQHLSCNDNLDSKRKDYQNQLCCIGSYSCALSWAEPWAVLMSKLVPVGLAYRSVLFLFFYGLFESYFYYVATDKLTSPNGGKFRWMALMYVLLCRYVDVSTLQTSRIVVKQTNCNWRMFSTFNIIETLQSYFTHELLPDYLSSQVALRFNIN